MADDHHRAIIIVERLHQRLAAVDVQMVGRFVEDQQMRRIAGDERQRQPRPLATGHAPDLLDRPLTRKAEPPQLRAHRAGGCALHHAGHMFQRRVGDVQFLHLILGEIANLHLGRALHLPFHRRELRRDQAGQRRLAVAVAAQQRQPVVRVDAQIDPAQDRRVAIADRRHVHGDQRRAQFGRAGEAERQRGVFDRRRNRLHPRQRLGARLGLFRSGCARGVARDIILQFLPLGLLLDPRRFKLGQAFGPLPLECVIATGIEGDLAALQMQDIIDDVVEQVALMTDDDHRAPIGFQEIFQPHRRFKVEMVRRLVEQ